LIQKFEAIYLKNLTSTRDYEAGIDLDISKNNLTDISIKYLADILKKFNGFRSLNLSSLGKMKDTGIIEFAKALKESTSLIKLDFSKNNLSKDMIHELLLSIQENYVISEIIIELKGKSIPWGFSNNILSSMFEIYIS
jgi:Ran GTPase-activating protein (RanGAP) involved in mRNA processing and transport